MTASPGRSLIYALIAFAGGLLAWLVVDALLERRQVPEGPRMELEQRTASNLETMRDRLTDELAARMNNEAQQRMDTPRGQALFRMCVEWTEFNEKHPDEDTARARDDACRKLKHYIDEGDVPE